MSSTGTQTLAIPLTMFTTPLSVLTTSISRMRNKDQPSSKRIDTTSQKITPLRTRQRGAPPWLPVPERFTGARSATSSHDLSKTAGRQPGSIRCATRQTDTGATSTGRSGRASARGRAGQKPPGRSTLYAAYPLANPCGGSLADETQTSPPFSTPFTTPQSQGRPAYQTLAHVFVQLAQNDAFR
jgi:hypothetical protein